MIVYGVKNRNSGQFRHLSIERPADPTGRPHEIILFKNDDDYKAWRAQYDAYEDRPGNCDDTPFHKTSFERIADNLSTTFLATARAPIDIASGRKVFLFEHHQRIIGLMETSATKTLEALDVDKMSFATLHQTHAEALRADDRGQTKVRARNSRQQEGADNTPTPSAPRNQLV